MKVLIIWLWNHGKKNINFFVKKRIHVFWICKTQKTKEYIEKKYNIDVSFDYKKIIIENNFEYIVFALPTSIQWDIALDVISMVNKDTKIILWTNICDYQKQRDQFIKYDNIWYFLEENHSLLNKLFRKIKLNSISEIKVYFTVSKEDFKHKYSEIVAIVHLINHFVWLNINFKIFQIEFSRHKDNNTDINFNLDFAYSWKNFRYIFLSKQKYLLIDWKKYIDDFSFDSAMEETLRKFEYYVLIKKDFNRLLNILY